MRAKQAKILIAILTGATAVWAQEEKTLSQTWIAVRHEMFGIQKFECHIMPGRFALNYSGDVGHKTFKGEVSDREISKIRKKLSQILFLRY